MPIRTRREQAGWTDSERAAWIDLYLASFEVEGYFDSLPVVRAHLGSRSGAADGLIAMEELVELDDGRWILVAYHQMYAGRRPGYYKSIDQHLADAEAKTARGEPLSSLERWARHKARQRGDVLPDPRRKTSGVTEARTTDEEEEEPNVEQTLGMPCPKCDGDLVRKFRRHGEFLGCDQYPHCSYSEELPPQPPKPFEPDWESIKAAHGGELPPGMTPRRRERLPHDPKRLPMPH